ncbi:IS110 family RNA-guided transposase [Filimonas effusa]|uniref:IS110 family transposase n=1 Tax=Filimonas effusa TaxID=2508721 RepID=A0A4V1M9B7_9BACT|nr:IS110 family transposase [Filimonas effusa]RXK80435.1 IS110 family transposase [Filimonas effusa]
MKKLFVGIDVSKLWLDVSTVHNDQPNQYIRVDNTKSGFRSLLNWLKKQAKVENWLICLEHTGIYAQPLWQYLTEKRIPFSVVAGTVINAGIAIKRGKSDKVDSLAIAKFAKRYADELKPHRLPAELLKRLKMLFAYRDRLVKAKVSLEVPATEAEGYSPKDSSEMREDCKEVVEFLRLRIKRLEKMIVEIIKSDPDTTKCYDLIMTVPGIGIVTACYLLIVTECFSLFKSSRQLACYGGIAPFEHTSGSSIRGKTRVSAKADKKLKALLSRGVSTLLIHHLPTKDYFERKIAEGKHQNLIRNNLKNKLLHTVFSVIRRSEPYDPCYRLAVH